MVFVAGKEMLGARRLFLSVDQWTEDVYATCLGCYSRVIMLLERMLFLV